MRTGANGNGMLGAAFHPPAARRLPPVAEMSAQQRSQLLEAMHAQVNAVTVQVNELTRACQAMAQTTDAEDASIKARVQQHYDEFAMLDSDYDGHIAWHTGMSSFWRRLRWLVRGK